jgi:phage host-nuclease inhibitor protein Gam
MCKKVTKNTLESTLIEMGGFQAQLNTVLERQNQEILAIQKKYQDKIETMNKEIDERYTAVGVYATANRDTLFPKKAKSVTIGAFTLSFRKNPDTVQVADEAETLTLLKKFKLTACYKTVETLVKPALKELSDEDKKKCKVTMKEGEETFSIN